MSERTARRLRLLVIVLVGLGVLATLLGGLGTTCVAFNAEQYGARFAVFTQYKTEYQAMVYVSVVTALAGIAATWALARGRRWGYAASLVVLLLGLATAGVQMYYTSTLRQVSFFATPPTNMRFWATALGVLALLALRLPGVWQKAGMDKAAIGSGAAGTAGGLTACVMGIVTLTTPLWAGPSHMLEGYNLVYVLEWPLLLGGLALFAGGIVAMVLSRGVRVALSLRRPSAA